jgi:hypothetical protein
MAPTSAEKSHEHQGISARQAHAPSAWRNRRALVRTGGVAAGVLLIVLLLLLGWYWSREPDVFWVDWEQTAGPAVTGYRHDQHPACASRSTLLEKPGGYLTNDVLPPSVFLDNMPNWEFGVLVQVRDLARVMRNDFSRSQTQSVRRQGPRRGQNRISISTTTAGSCRRARAATGQAIEPSRELPAAPARPGAARRQLLRARRQSPRMARGRREAARQPLAAAVGERRARCASTPTWPANARRTRASSAPTRSKVKTPWLEIDDVFYEARGTAWALLHFLRAIEYDFRHVLADKNATVSLRQVIRELEASLAPMRSPIVLNGSGFGLFAESFAGDGVLPVARQPGHHQPAGAAGRRLN